MESTCWKYCSWMSESTLSTMQRHYSRRLLWVSFHHRQIWPACLAVSGETTGDWGQWGQWGHQCTFNCRLSRLCVIALILELIISQLWSSQEIREINGRRAKTCLTLRINGSCHQLSLSPQNVLSQTSIKSIHTYHTSSYNLNWIYYIIYIYDNKLSK